MYAFADTDELRAADIVVLYVCAIAFVSLIGGKAAHYYLTVGTAILPLILAIAFGYSAASYFIRADTSNLLPSLRPASMLVYFRNGDPPLSARVLRIRREGITPIQPYFRQDPV